MGVMEMNEYSSFHKAPTLLGPRQQIEHLLVATYHTEEMQSVYSTTPADWAV